MIIIVTTQMYNCDDDHHRRHYLNTILIMMREMYYDDNHHPRHQFSFSAELNQPTLKRTQRLRNGVRLKLTSLGKPSF